MSALRELPIARATIVCCVIVLLASRVLALSVHLSGVEPNDPFDIDYVASDETPLELVLQIGNTSSGTESILYWQLQLTLYPAPSAEGSVKFVPHVSAPPDSLFGQDPGPIDFMGEDPSTDVFCFDGTLEETGEAIPPETSRNIVRLTLEVEAGTSGDFELAMQLFEPETETGAAWLEEGAMSPQAFENFTISSLSGYLLLGTIHVEDILLGDYNDDDKVSAADYTVWRDNLGSLVSMPNDLTTGVDENDFQVWIDNYGSARGSTFYLAMVPEPSSLTLLAVACLLAGALSPSCTASETGGEPME